VRSFRESCCVTSTTIEEEDLVTWSRWINDPKIRENLSIDPDYVASSDSQAQYLRLEEDKGRTFRAIRGVDRSFLGLVTLKNLSQRNHSFLSIVFPTSSRTNPLLALEAVSIVMSEGFEDLKIERIVVGFNSERLKGWIHRMSLLGFSFDGFWRTQWNEREQESLQMSMNLSMYNSLILRRGGALWLGDQEMLRLNDAYRRETIALVGQPFLSSEFTRGIDLSNRMHHEILRNSEIQSGAR
jgi:hypothetical protein